MRRQETESRAKGALLAIALHGLAAAALAAAAMIADPDDRLGAQGNHLDAISVEVSLVAAAALESRARSQATEAAASGAVELDEGVPREPLAASSTPPPDEAEPARDGATRPQATVKAAPADAEASSPATPAMPDETTPLAPEPAEPAAQPVAVAKARQEPDTEQRAEAAAAKKTEDGLPPPRAEAQSSPAALAPGGAASRSAVAAEAREAAAAAPPGVVQAFARSVADALGRSRPKPAAGQGRGSVRIAFAVAEGGGLEFLRVAQSSGNSRLDQAAVDAVRRAHLPAPPAGMSIAQRTYEIPYHFR